MRKLKKFYPYQLQWAGHSTRFWFKTWVVVSTLVVGFLFLKLRTQTLIMLDNFYYNNFLFWGLLHPQNHQKSLKKLEFFSRSKWRFSPRRRPQIWKFFYWKLFSMVEFWLRSLTPWEIKYPTTSVQPTAVGKRKHFFLNFFQFSRRIMSF